MTPQYILRASLCRPANCIGEYEEKHGGRNKFAESEIDNLGFARSYSEPGYSHPSKGSLFANWNYFPRGIDSLLERYGYAVEWSDEWATCEDCGNAVRTSPDCWFWTPSFELVDECSIVCNNCRAQSILESAIYSLDKDEDAQAIEILRATLKHFKG